MMPTDIVATLTDSVIALGYVRFAVILIIGVLFWRKHSLLGLIFTLMTLGYLLHLF